MNAGRSGPFADRARAHWQRVANGGALCEPGVGFMLIISDIHGCHRTLMRLLRKCPDEPIVLAGDLMDRGPSSREVVEFAMQEGVPTVLGNHDDLMLEFVKTKSAMARFDWMSNGGEETLRSWGGAIPETVISWFEELPYYLTFGRLLVSHTGHGLVAEKDRFSALWSRDFHFPDDGWFRVFGHTQQLEPVVTDSYACIDTGAAYGGQLTALHWPSLRIFQQKYDESPL